MLVGLGKSELTARVVGYSAIVIRISQDGSGAFLGWAGAKGEPPLSCRVNKHDSGANAPELPHHGMQSIWCLPWESP